MENLTWHNVGALTRQLTIARLPCKWRRRSNAPKLSIWALQTLPDFSGTGFPSPWRTSWTLKHGLISAQMFLGKSSNHNWGPLWTRIYVLRSTSSRDDQAPKPNLTLHFFRLFRYHFHTSEKSEISQSFSASKILCISFVLFWFLADRLARIWFGGTRSTPILCALHARNRMIIDSSSCQQMPNLQVCNLAEIRRLYPKQNPRGQTWDPWKRHTRAYDITCDRKLGHNGISLNTVLVAPQGKTFQIVQSGTNRDHLLYHLSLFCTCRNPVPQSSTVPCLSPWNATL